MEKKAPGPPGIIVTALVLLPIGWLMFTSGAISPMIWTWKGANGMVEGGASFWYECSTIKSYYGHADKTICTKLGHTGCDDWNEHLDGGKAAGIIAIVLSAVYLAFIIVDICCRNVLVSWLGGLIGLMAFVFSCITWIIAAAIWQEGFCNFVAFKDRPGADLGFSFYDMFFGSVLMGAAILMHWINRSFCVDDPCCNECCPCTCCCPHCFAPDEMNMLEGSETENEIDIEPLTENEIDIEPTKAEE